MTIPTQSEAIGLMRLAATAHAAKQIADQATYIVNGGLTSLNMVINYRDQRGLPAVAVLNFPNREDIPKEFKQAMHDYASRLCGEMWLAEDAVITAKQKI